MAFLREVKAGGPVLGTKSAKTAFHIPTWSRGRPYAPGWNTERAVQNGLQKVIYVFRGVHAIADNQARLPIVSRKGNRDTGEVDETHPVLKLLNFKPNQDQSAYDVRYALSAQIMLSRRGAFIEVVRSITGEPVALYLHQPDKIAPVPPTTGQKLRLVDHFQVDVGEGQKPETLPPEDVLWFKLPHPTDPYSSLTPLEPLGVTVDIDFLARLYNRTFLQNDGRPGGIVAVKGDMEDDVEQELDDRWNRGTMGAGRISVINAEGLDFVDTAISPRDAQYVEMMNLTKETILGGLGVPEPVAMAYAADRTYENAETEESIFWKSTMFGHCRLLSDQFDKLDEDDNVHIGYDFSGVEALQRAEKARREELRAEFTAGLRTLNGYLEATGEERIEDDPAADAYMLPMSSVPTVYADGVDPPEPAVPPAPSNVVPIGGDDPTEAATALQAAALALLMETKGRVGPPFRYGRRRGGA